MENQSEISCFLLSLFMLEQGKEKGKGDTPKHGGTEGILWKEQSRILGLPTGKFYLTTNERDQMNFYAYH